MTKKKKIIIIAVVAILVILLFPIRLNLKDGGSVSYRSLVYEITKVHRLELEIEVESDYPYADGIKIKILGMTVYSKIDEPHSKTDEIYFIAKAEEIFDGSMIVTVSDKGTSSLKAGDKLSVSTEKIAGVIANNKDTITDNYLKIAFSGEVMETYPLQIGSVSQIDITDKDGNPIE